MYKSKLLFKELSSVYRNVSLSFYIASFDQVVWPSSRFHGQFVLVVKSFYNYIATLAVKVVELCYIPPLWRSWCYDGKYPMCCGSGIFFRPVSAPFEFIASLLWTVFPCSLTFCVIYLWFIKTFLTAFLIKGQLFNTLWNQREFIWQRGAISVHFVVTVIDASTLYWAFHNLPQIRAASA